MPPRPHRRPGTRPQTAEAPVSRQRPANLVGEMRHSASVTTHGPGAIVDLRTPEGAAVAVVMACADEWESTPNRGDILNDPRLEARLGVNYFRMPPTFSKDEYTGVVPGVRFPRSLQCPQCGRITEWRNFAPAKEGSATRFCATCTGRNERERKVLVVPVRFVMACRNGHLQDFPWEDWVDHKADCTSRRTIRLKALSGGLAGLRVFCDGCGASRSMQEAFNPALIRKWKCSGHRPWTSLPAETCDEELHVLQRGASNLYFPIVRSSLLIPPWDDEIIQLLGDRWGELLTTMPEEREAQVRSWASGGFVDIPRDTSDDDFVHAVMGLVRRRDAESDGDLRTDEWAQITQAMGRSSSEFEARKEEIPPPLDGLVGSLVRVVRLRELRALIGFTRISSPPSEQDDATVASCSVFQRPARWFPALEVRGEGIFVGLDNEALRAWEAKESVQRRSERINEAWISEYKERHDVEEPPQRQLTARFLLTHALSHALMRQLSLECGYSSSSLRERLYVGDYGAAVLIYTATSDADGTLGGLERQGRPERFMQTLRDGIQAMRWCSSDPLCIEGAMMASNACNVAACHACLLASETSCEEFNRFLDRALLVGTPSDSSIGFFSTLIAE